MIRFLLPVENGSATGSHKNTESWLSWSKAHDWKSCLRESVTRVRIPNSPPEKRSEAVRFQAFFIIKHMIP